MLFKPSNQNSSINENQGFKIKSKGEPWKIILKEKIAFNRFPLVIPLNFLSCNEFACNAGDLGWILRMGRCPGEGNGNSLQYSCLRNPTDRGTWQAIVHRVTKESGATWWLNNNCYQYNFIGHILHSVLLPGESHGQRSLAGYSPWGHKESDTTEPVSMSIISQQNWKKKYFGEGNGNPIQYSGLEDPMNRGP